MRRYIADIDNIGIVSYRIGALDDVSVTNEISVICQHFMTLFRHFNVNFEDNNYMSKTEYLIWQCDTSLPLVTSLLVRNGS